MPHRGLVFLLSFLLSWELDFDLIRTHVTNV